MKTLGMVLVLVMAWFGSPALAADNIGRSTTPLLLAQAQSSQIDINRATAEQLMTLKGIGDARAKAIIKGRPYARKDELVQKGIIPQSVYDGIREQIIAKQ